MREYVKDRSSGTPPLQGIITVPSDIAAPAKPKPVSMKTDHSPMAKAIAAQQTADAKKKATAASPTPAEIKAAEDAKAAAEQQ